MLLALLMLLLALPNVRRQTNESKLISQHCQITFTVAPITGAKSNTVVYVNGAYIDLSYLSNFCVAWRSGHSWNEDIADVLLKISLAAEYVGKVLEVVILNRWRLSQVINLKCLKRKWSKLVSPSV
jgi:hypothetical protein